MQPSRQINLDTPATLTVVAWPDPVVEAHGHKPGSPYIHGVWLGCLGPSTTLCFERLSRIAIACPNTPVDTVDLAISLGLGENLGRNSAISRTLGRMVAFGAAHRCEDTIAVRRALPDVPDRMLARLSYTARIAHEHLAQSTPTPSTHHALAVEVGL
jgi:hypothetical protein